MNIEGVPDSVPWPKVAAFLESLGLDLGKMPARRGGVVIGDRDIRCIVYAYNPDGHRYADRATGKIATHEIRIPLTDTPWPQAQPPSDQTPDVDTCRHVIQDGAPACDCGEHRIVA